MPAAELNAPETARVAKGLCACGCGEPLPEHRGWGTRQDIYISKAHKQRAYRARLKEGRVIPQEKRNRDSAREEARSLLAQAEWAKDRAARAKAEEKRLRKEAKALLAYADGQQQIPGVKPGNGAK